MAVIFKICSNVQVGIKAYREIFDLHESHKPFTDAGPAEGSDGLLHHEWLRHLLVPRQLLRDSLFPAAR